MPIAKSAPCLLVMVSLTVLGCGDDDGRIGTLGTGASGTGASGTGASGTGADGGGGSGTGAGSTGGAGVGGAGVGGQAACSEAQLLNDDARLPADVAQQLLDMHNAKRTEYCLEPMVWDCNLARVAQDYADLGGAGLDHNDARHGQYAAIADCGGSCPQLGENLAWHQPYDFFPITDGMTSWLSEEDPVTCNSGGGHYTQIVWETATKVGCGMWIDDNDGTKLHLVCNYIEFQLSGDPFPIANCSGCS